MKLRAIIFSLQTVFNRDDLFRFMQLVYRFHPNERYRSIESTTNSQV